MQNAVQHCSPLMLPPYLTLPADHTSASVSASILSLSLSIFITLPVNGLANERMHGYDSTPHSTHRANDYYRAQLSKSAWSGWLAGWPARQLQSQVESLEQQISLSDDS